MRRYFLKLTIVSLVFVYFSGVQSAVAQLNIDSLKNVAATTASPMDRLTAFRMLSKSGNREEALKYSLLTIHFADSLLKVRGYDEKVIFSLKAGGMWNY